MSDEIIAITDKQWCHISCHGALADAARPCLESALTFYSQCRLARENQPRASETKKELRQVAEHAAKLRQALADIDPYAFMALGELASKLNSEQAGPEALRMISHPRLETITILRDAIACMDRVNVWATAAAGQIENMPPGASASRPILDYFVWQAAIVFENYADREFSNCRLCRAYLHDLLDLVDQPVTDNAIEEAASNAEVWLSKIRSQTIG